MCEFSRQIMKHVVAQICQSHNFTGIENSACDALVDILQRYIEEIGYYSSLYAQHAGRVDCNANDILLGLAELNVSFNDLRAHFSHSQDVLLPFDKSIPKFPVPQKAKKHKALDPNRSGGLHILPHFGPLPEKHTYLDNSLFSEKEMDLKEMQEKKLLERNQTQASLLKIHKLKDNHKINDTEVLNFELLSDEDFQKFKATFREIYPEKAKETELAEGTVCNQKVYDCVKVLLETVHEEPPKQEDKGESKEKLGEKQLKRIDLIVNFSHNGNALEDVPSNLLDNPPPTPTPTPTTSTSTPVTPAPNRSMNIYQSNLPVVSPFHNPMIQQQQMLQQQQLQQQLQQQYSQMYPGLY
jgi:histone H3/H4